MAHSSQSSLFIVSQVTNQEIELGIQVRLKLKSLEVTLLDANLLLFLEVHLVVILDALVGALGHHARQVLEHNSRL